MKMRNLDNSDTIAAIATAPGEGGIGIVRISGKDACRIADRVFVSKSGRKPSECKTFTTHYGWVTPSHKSQVTSHKKKNSKQSAGRPEKFIDEVILTVMKAPRTYTKEDVVEINCHGGFLALRSVLDLVVTCGARLAEPGEFTKRAFLNGRIDLAQAEAVIDVIRAKTEAALLMGAAQLRGGLSVAVHKIRETLLRALSILEANIDFPDEGPDCEVALLSQDLTRAKKELGNMLDSSKMAKVLREGVHVVICGKPNVGKSSLLNAFLREERSIVTPIAGTTRDAIEEIIDLKGIPMRIVDTAGILEPRDLIEKKAVLRSRQHIKTADLVILVFDATERLSKEDLFLMKKLKGKAVVPVINKIDLRQRIEKEKIVRKLGKVVEISAKNLRNFKILEETIVSLVLGGQVRPPESAWVSNRRHTKALEAAEKLIADSLRSLDNKVPLEFVAQDIKEALIQIDEILGKKFSEDLLDKIFSDFCIGK